MGEEQGKILAFCRLSDPLDEQLVGVIDVCSTIHSMSHFEALGFAAHEMALGQTSRKQHCQASKQNCRRSFQPFPILCIFCCWRRLIYYQGNPSYGEYTGKTLHQLCSRNSWWIPELYSAGVENQKVFTVRYREWIAGREIWFSARIARFSTNGVCLAWISLQKASKQPRFLKGSNRMAREIHDHTRSGVCRHSGSGAANRCNGWFEAAQAH